MSADTSDTDILPAGSVLLETTRQDGGEGRILLFRNPVSILELRDAAACGDFFDRLGRGLREGLYAAGFFAYEAGACFEKLPGTIRPELPLAWFGLYEAPETADLPPYRPAADPGVTIHGFSIGREAYERLFSAVKDHIREGDVYQINLTGKIRFSVDGDPLRLYRRLKAVQPVPYSAYLDIGSEAVISLSPELFFRIENGRITARPMKGTAPRGRFPAEDERLRETLRNDPKSRAENLMIVDLLRNDLSRVCRPGSVRVPRLFDVETYSTVLQMTSTITGKLLPGAAPEAVLRALFPCGSVTGAPKIRAMEIISELEPEPRGVYTGAIGMFEPGGNAVFSVAIRTVVLRDRRGEMGTGGGIVWDSDAGREYDECLLKASFLTRKPIRFQLIETMRWENGIRLLDAHLERLHGSARYFDFRLDLEEVKRKIAACGASLEPGSPYRMRLLLSRDGTAEAAAAPLDPSEGRRWKMLVSERRLDSSDPFHFHKTTLRHVYEDEYAAARRKGYDEVLFLNERDELTQGSRTNVFIRLGRRWLTPPVTCGLLPGVYRRHLIETLPGIRQEPLSLDELRNADEILLCNAVRGAIPAGF